MHDGKAYVYGRRRAFRVKELACRWSVTGLAEPVRVVAVEVDGYAGPWFLCTTSATMTAAEVVCVFAARFRQEDGFRDHKPRLGMEECRAWTTSPVGRTFAVQVVAQTLLRLLGWRLDRACGAGGWWSVPGWNRHKTHPSLLDGRPGRSSRTSSGGWMTCEKTNRVLGFTTGRPHDTPGCPGHYYLDRKARDV